MSKISIREAINRCLDEEMARDERVVIMGEDVASRDAGGVYGITMGLADKYGERRVIDTPITESAIIGAAGGAALTGLRPVAELMFIDFLGVCLDQLMNQIAKFRYMFGGGATTPVTIRTMIGAGSGSGPQHSAILYPMLVAIPGLKVVAPSNAYDAKGLLAQAIRDDDPVVFCEHKSIYTEECEVPVEPYTIPFGKARTVCEGTDVTVVAFSRMVLFAEQVANKLASEGISVEVIDPRTLSPLDDAAIIASVQKTSRLVVVDEATPYCSMASEVSSLVADRGFDYLDAPIKKVTAPHTPVPASPVLEAQYVPSVEEIEAAIRDVVGY
jgi:pyruvate/2-oxoglutarate/acetoin dehydrogenase E1 component